MEDERLSFGWNPLQTIPLKIPMTVSLDRGFGSDNFRAFFALIHVYKIVQCDSQFPVVNWKLIKSNGGRDVTSFFCRLVSLQQTVVSDACVFHRIIKVHGGEKSRLNGNWILDYNWRESFVHSPAAFSTGIGGNVAETWYNCIRSLMPVYTPRLVIEGTQFSRLLFYLAA